jgi:flagellar assembly protein FliH
MISLSRIIKASGYLASSEKIALSVTAPALKTEQVQERLQENQKIFLEAKKEAAAIIRDAEETAETLLAEAARQAELRRDQAEKEMAKWREERLQVIEEMAQQRYEQARQEGYAAGYEAGKQAAMEEERERVERAGRLLEQAHSEKERIINEAEPFLVGLSTEIARKIIGRELAAAPEQVLAMVGEVLRRSRVHGEITVCVNHRFYDFVAENRAELLALLDGQAELSIIPDYSVQDEGCVIRTPLGSVDAKIDTQLKEIKQVLLEIARGSEAYEAT